MNFHYDPSLHVYTVDGQKIPSLTEMLAADGCNEHLARAPSATVEAKAEWGSALHLALQKVEYGYGVTDGFQQHCIDWLTACERMGWGKNHMPIWKVAELPQLARVSDFLFGFTPDRAAPEAVIELKGTFSPHFSHGIQTALQVLGMGYPRDTPRWIAYFDRNGLKKLHQCGPTILRDGYRLDVFDEAMRIIFERATHIGDIKEQRA